MKKTPLLFCICFLLVAKLATAQTVNCTLTPTISPADTTVCSGAIVKLTASGGDSYTWSNGDTGSVITVYLTTDSGFTVTAKSGSCSGTASDTITVTLVPQLNIVPQYDTICPGNSVMLIAIGGSGLTYKWTSNGDTNTLATTDTLTVNPLNTTTYYLISSNGTCSGMDSAIVAVVPAFPVRFHAVEATADQVGTPPTIVRT